jgi:hypothetical protein
VDQKTGSAECQGRGDHIIVCLHVSASVFVAILKRDMKS